jgi:hypothetical protein
MKPTVIIIGAVAPPALTAALELVRDGRMQPIVLEAGDDVGGLSRTVEYKGNRMDIGGHRFFSKSDWVMNWWREILPIAADQAEVSIAYRGRERKVGADDTAIPADGRALLVRKRLSRIYFLRRYFDYPITLNATTLRNLGPLRLLRIGASYLRRCHFSATPGTVAGGLSGQSLRRRAVPHLFQGLHGKSLGRALPADRGRLGFPADQGAVRIRRPAPRPAAAL